MYNKSNSVRPPDFPKPSASPSHSSQLQARLKNRLILRTGFSLNNSVSNRFSNSKIPGYGESQFDIDERDNRDIHINLNGEVNFVDQKSVDRNPFVSYGSVDSYAQISKPAKVKRFPSLSLDEVDTTALNNHLSFRASSIRRSKDINTNTNVSVLDLKKQRYQQTGIAVDANASVLSTDEWDLMTDGLLEDAAKDFCYLDQQDDHDFYKFGVHKQYPNTILQNKFVTLSRNGVVRCETDGDSDFVNSQKFHQELRIYYKLKDLKIFGCYRLIKSIYWWRAYVRTRKFKRMSVSIGSKLCILDQFFQEMFVVVRSCCCDIEQLNLLTLSSYKLQEKRQTLSEVNEFSALQKAVMEKYNLTVNRFIANLIQYLCRRCEIHTLKTSIDSVPPTTTLQEFKSLAYKQKSAGEGSILLTTQRTKSEDTNKLDVSNDLNGSGPLRQFITGDNFLADQLPRFASEIRAIFEQGGRQISYTEKASVRNQCRRLAHFLRLIDFMLRDAKYSVTEKELKTFYNILHGIAPETKSQSKRGNNSNKVVSDNTKDNQSNPVNTSNRRKSAAKILAKRNSKALILGAGVLSAKFEVNEDIELLGSYNTKQHLTNPDNAAKFQQEVMQEKGLPWDINATFKKYDVGREFCRAVFVLHIVLQDNSTEFSESSYVSNKNNVPEYCGSIVLQRRDSIQSMEENWQSNFFVMNSTSNENEDNYQTSEIINPLKPSKYVTVLKPNMENVLEELENLVHNSLKNGSFTSSVFLLNPCKELLTPIATEIHIKGVEDRVFLDGNSVDYLRSKCLDIIQSDYLLSLEHLRSYDNLCLQYELNSKTFEQAKQSKLLNNPTEELISFLDDFEHQLEYCRSIIDGQDIGIYRLDFRNLKGLVLKRLEDCKQLFHRLIPELYTGKGDQFYLELSNICDVLASKFHYLEEFVHVVNVFQSSKDKSENYQEEYEYLTSIREVIERYSIKTSDNVIRQTVTLAGIWHRFSKLSSDFEDKFEENINVFQVELNKRTKDLLVPIHDAGSFLQSDAVLNPDSEPDDVITALTKIKLEIEEVQRKGEELIMYQTAMKVVSYDRSEVMSMMNQINSNFLLWNIMRTIRELQINFMSVHFLEAASEEVETQLRNCAFILSRKIIPGTSPRVVAWLSSTLGELQIIAPIVRKLQSHTLEEDQLELIMKTLNRRIYDDDDVTVGYLVDVVNIKPFAVVLDQIYDDSLCLFNLKSEVQEIMQRNEEIEFELEYDKENKTLFFITNFDQIINFLEDGKTSIQSCCESIYSTPIKEKFQKNMQTVMLWIDRLKQMKSIQKGYKRIRNLFTNARTARYLSSCLKYFKSLDEAWRSLVRNDTSDQSIAKVLENAQLQEYFQLAALAIDSTDKQFQNYILEQCKRWPKLYLLDPEYIYDIFGTQEPSQTFRMCRNTLFQNISDVIFSDIEPYTVTGVISGSETVLFRKSCSSRNNLVDWFKSMESALSDRLELDIKDFVNESKLIIEEIVVPTTTEQSRIVSVEIAFWRSFMEVMSVKSLPQQASLSNNHQPVENRSYAPSRRGLKSQLQEVKDQISMFSTLLSNHTDPSSIRTTANLLILIISHRDFLSYLLNDPDAEDMDTSFTIESSLKKFLNPFNSTISIHQGCYRFLYGMRYQGNIDSNQRLVITPLTEKFFLSITIALKQLTLPIIYGAEGSGKRCTINALTYSLGCEQVNFSCQSILNPTVMINVLKATLSCSLWLNLNDAEKLKPDLYSLLLTSLSSTQNFLDAKMTNFQIAGESFEIASTALNPSARICILYNTHQSDSERSGIPYLPASTQQQFRPISFYGPSRQTILHVLLAANNYAQVGRICARLDTLCEYLVAHEIISEKIILKHLVSSIQAVGVQTNNLPHKQVIQIQELVKHFMQSIPLAYQDALKDIDLKFIANICLETAYDHSMESDFKITIASDEFARALYKLILHPREYSCNIFVVGATHVGKSVLIYQATQHAIKQNNEKVDKYLHEMSNLNQSSLTENKKSKSIQSMQYLKRFDRTVNPYLLAAMSPKLPPDTDSSSITLSAFRAVKDMISGIQTTKSISSNSARAVEVKDIFHMDVRTSAELSSLVPYTTQWIKQLDRNILIVWECVELTNIDPALATSVPTLCIKEKSFGVEDIIRWQLEHFCRSESDHVEVHQVMQECLDSFIRPCIENYRYDAIISKLSLIENLFNMISCIKRQTGLVKSDSPSSMYRQSSKSWDELTLQRIVIFSCIWTFGVCSPNGHAYFDLWFKEQYEGMNQSMKAKELFPDMTGANSVFNSYLFAPDEFDIKLKWKPFTYQALPLDMEQSIDDEDVDSNQPLNVPEVSFDSMTNFAGNQRILTTEKRIRQLMARVRYANIFHPSMMYDHDLSSLLVPTSTFRAFQLIQSALISNSNANHGSLRDNVKGAVTHSRYMKKGWGEKAGHILISGSAGSGKKSLLQLLSQQSKLDLNQYNSNQLDVENAKMSSKTTKREKKSTLNRWLCQIHDCSPSEIMEHLDTGRKLVAPLLCERNVADNCCLFIEDVNINTETNIQFSCAEFLRYLFEHSEFYNGIRGAFENGNNYYTVLSSGNQNGVKNERLIRHQMLVCCNPKEVESVFSKKLVDYCPTLHMELARDLTSISFQLFKHFKEALDYQMFPSSFPILPNQFLTYGWEPPIPFSSHHHDSTHRTGSFVNGEEKLFMLSVFHKSVTTTVNYILSKLATGLNTFALFTSNDAIRVWDRIVFDFSNRYPVASELLSVATEKACETESKFTYPSFAAAVLREKSVRRSIRSQLSLHSQSAERINAEDMPKAEVHRPIDVVSENGMVLPISYLKNASGYYKPGIDPKVFAGITSAETLQKLWLLQRSVVQPTGKTMGMDGSGMDSGMDYSISGIDVDSLDLWTDIQSICAHLTINGLDVTSPSILILSGCPVSSLKSILQISCELSNIVYFPITLDREHFIGTASERRLRDVTGDFDKEMGSHKTIHSNNPIHLEKQNEKIFENLILQTDRDYQDWIHHQSAGGDPSFYLNMTCSQLMLLFFNSPYILYEIYRVFELDMTSPNPFHTSSIVSRLDSIQKLNPFKRKTVLDILNIIRNVSTNPTPATSSHIKHAIYIHVRSSICFHHDFWEHFYHCINFNSSDCFEIFSAVWDGFDPQKSTEMRKIIIEYTTFQKYIFSFDGLELMQESIERISRLSKVSSALQYHTLYHSYNYLLSELSKTLGDEMSQQILDLLKGYATTMKSIAANKAIHVVEHIEDSNYLNGSIAQLLYLYKKIVHSGKDRFMKQEMFILNNQTEADLNKEITDIDMKDVLEVDADVLAMSLFSTILCRYNVMFALHHPSFEVNQIAVDVSKTVLDSKMFQIVDHKKLHAVVAATLANISSEAHMQTNTKSQNNNLPAVLKLIQALPDGSSLQLGLSSIVIATLCGGTIRILVDSIFGAELFNKVTNLSNTIKIGENILNIVIELSRPKRISSNESSELSNLTTIYADSPTQYSALPIADLVLVSILQINQGHQHNSGELESCIPELNDVWIAASDGTHSSHWMMSQPEYLEKWNNTASSLIKPIDSLGFMWQSLTSLHGLEGSFLRILVGEYLMHLQFIMRFRHFSNLSTIPSNEAMKTFDLLDLADGSGMKLLIIVSWSIGFFLQNTLKRILEADEYSTILFNTFSQLIVNHRMDEGRPHHDMKLVEVANLWTALLIKLRKSRGNGVGFVQYESKQHHDSVLEILNGLNSHTSLFGDVAINPIIEEDQDSRNESEDEDAIRSDFKLIESTRSVLDDCLVLAERIAQFRRDAEDNRRADSHQSKSVVMQSICSNADEWVDWCAEEENINDLHTEILFPTLELNRELDWVEKLLIAFFLKPRIIPFILTHAVLEIGLNLRASEWNENYFSNQTSADHPPSISLETSYNAFKSQQEEKGTKPSSSIVFCCNDMHQSNLNTMMIMDKELHSDERTMDEAAKKALVPSVDSPDASHDNYHRLRSSSKFGHVNIFMNLDAQQRRSISENKMMKYLKMVDEKYLFHFEPGQKASEGSSQSVKKKEIRIVFESHHNYRTQYSESIDVRLKRISNPEESDAASQSQQDIPVVASVDQRVLILRNKPSDVGHSNLDRLPSIPYHALNPFNKNSIVNLNSFYADWLRQIYTLACDSYDFEPIAKQFQPMINRIRWIVLLFHTSLLFKLSGPYDVQRTSFVNVESLKMAWRLVDFIYSDENFSNGFAGNANHLKSRSNATSSLRNATQADRFDPYLLIEYILCGAYYPTITSEWIRKVIRATFTTYFTFECCNMQIPYKVQGVIAVPDNFTEPFANNFFDSLKILEESRQISFVGLVSSTLCEVNAWNYSLAHGTIDTMLNNQRIVQSQHRSMKLNGLLHPGQHWSIENRLSSELRSIATIRHSVMKLLQQLPQKIDVDLRNSGSDALNHHQHHQQHDYHHQGVAHGASGHRKASHSMLRDIDPLLLFALSESAQFNQLIDHLVHQLSLILHHCESEELRGGGLLKFIQDNCFSIALDRDGDGGIILHELESILDALMFGIIPDCWMKHRRSGAGDLWQSTIPIHLEEWVGQLNDHKHMLSGWIHSGHPGLFLQLHLLQNPFGLLHALRESYSMKSNLPIENLFIHYYLSSPGSISSSEVKALLTSNLGCHLLIAGVQLHNAHFSERSSELEFLPEYSSTRISQTLYLHITISAEAEQEIHKEDYLCPLYVISNLMSPQRSKSIWANNCTSFHPASIYQAMSYQHVNSVIDSTSSLTHSFCSVPIPTTEDVENCEMYGIALYSCPKWNIPM